MARKQYQRKLVHLTTYPLVWARIHVNRKMEKRDLQAGKS